MNYPLRIKAILAFLLIYSLHSFSQTTNTYTSGTTWNVPAGVNTIVIKVYGGGAGFGGRDCGGGCGNASPSNAGYIYASYNVTPGDVIGIYPGGRGSNGGNNVSGTGGGAAGVSPYNSSYNGGTGGNAGPNGFSGGGGGGGAASVLTINSSIKIVAGGAGGGGGMANAANSGKPGSSTPSANGTSNSGANGLSSVADGGGSGGGGGGHYGSVAGTLYTVGAETAGNGGHRGDNLITDAASVFNNNDVYWTSDGRIEITYHTGSAGGTASSNQNICPGNQPSGLTLTNFVGSSIQWQYSDDNSNWNNIVSANQPSLSGAQMGNLTYTRYYRAMIDGTVYSSTVTVTVVYVTVTAPSGSGTELDPYLISSMENLNWITADDSRWDKHYKQTTNINASPTQSSCYNSGQGYSPIGNASVKFTGSYDGQGYSIANLRIERGSDEYVGLFGYLSGATVSNLIISNGSITGGKYIGMLSAYADGQTTITDVEVSGSIQGNLYDVESAVGGLIGWFSGSQGVIDGNSSSVNINCYDYTGSTSFFGGGMFGVLESNCRNSTSNGYLSLYGDYYGNISMGGFAGTNSGQVNNCYTTANLDLSSAEMSQYIYIGGFTGNNSGEIDSCNAGGFTNVYDINDAINIYIGGFAGHNNAEISNSHTTQYLSIYYAYNAINLYVGGFAGYNDAEIRNSFSNSYVETYGTYWATYSSMGGFTGFNNNTIINCYSLSQCYEHSNISGNSYAGGFTGENYGQITNSYAAGYAYGNNTQGGLVANNNGTITNSFYDIDNSNVGDDGSGYGRTNSEMKQLATFFNASWDFKCETLYGNEDVWRINSSDNNGYPTLFWQNYTMGCPEWVGTQDTDFGTSDNWGDSFVPAEGMDIVMSAAAVNDLVLPQNWSVGNITFNGAGKLIKIDNYNITLGGIVTGADAANYIQTNGSGVVKKEITIGNSYDFPVGNSSYNPVSITNNTLSDDEFIINVMDEVYANGASGSPVTRNRVPRTWNIGKTNPNSGSGIDFVFNWNSGETMGSLTIPSLFHYGTSWAKQTDGSPSGTATSFSYTGYTGSFSPFSVMDGGSTLPVSWLGFTAQKQNNTSLLKWSTATEQNSDKFIVQHSSNGASWNVIGIKAAAGNSSSIKEYSFVHTSPVAGMNYYRLVQSDKDGKESYSHVISVNFDMAAKQVMIYPNPVTNGHLNIRLTQPANIRVFNNTGLLVMQEQMTAGEHPLNVSHLAKGIYNIKTEKETTTFVIQ